MQTTHGELIVSTKAVGNRKEVDLHSKIFPWTLCHLCATGYTDTWCLNWTFSERHGTGRFELGWKPSAKNSHSREDLTWCQSSVLQGGHWGRLWKRFLVALLPVNTPQAGARGEQPAHSLRADSQWMVGKGGAGKLGLLWKLLFGTGTDENCLAVAGQRCTRSAQSSIEPHLLTIPCLLLLLSWIDAAFSSLRQKTSIHLSAGSLDNLVSLPIWPWAFLLSISKEMRNGSVWFSELKWKIDLTYWKYSTFLVENTTDILTWLSTNHTTIAAVDKNVKAFVSCLTNADRKIKGQSDNDGWSLLYFDWEWKKF